VGPEAKHTNKGKKRDEEKTLGCLLIIKKPPVEKQTDGL